MSLIRNSKFVIRNSSAGFTLLEALIYIGLLTLVIGGSLGAVYNILSNSDNLRNKDIAEEEAIFLLGKIESTLNSVSAISIPSPGTLQVTNATGQITIAQSGTDMTIKRGISGPTAILNTARTSISDLKFTYQTNKVHASFNINGKPFETNRFIVQ